MTPGQKWTKTSSRMGTFQSIGYKTNI